MTVRQPAMDLAGILFRSAGTMSRRRLPIPASATVAEVGPDYKNPMWLRTTHYRGSGRRVGTESLTATDSLNSSSTGSETGIAVQKKQCH
jgi:hypothetical protein